MGIQGEGLHFYPLFWVFHDQWKYVYPNYRQQGDTEVFDHYGHMHMFLMGFDWGSPTQDAFSGSQDYTFEAKDIWGPRSIDPNQNTPYRVIGSPKWYFHVQEVWRRMYVQPWDLKVPGHVVSQQRGVRYDCSPSDQVMGPFREGRLPTSSYAPYFSKYGRTLPIDYYLTEDKSQDPGKRTNWILGPAHDLPASGYPQAFDPRHGNFLEVPNPCAVPTFSDRMYIFPIIEYQTVTQLDWQRMPGWAAAHDIDSDHFGDGWNVKVNIPFVSPVTGHYNSPFCQTPGVVTPIGSYYGSDAHGNPLVSNGSKPQYNQHIGDDYLAPSGVSPGQPITWNNPYPNTADGRWVQQCLGGMVLARCVVTIESKLGGRQDVTITEVSFKPTTQFSGTDQMSAAPR